MKILVIDVGGTNLKIGLTGRKEPLKVPSGSEMSAARMAAAVKKATMGWKYDAVSIGYPGPVVNGRPAQEPANLGAGWAPVSPSLCDSILGMAACSCISRACDEMSC